MRIAVTATLCLGLLSACADSTLPTAQDAARADYEPVEDGEVLQFSVREGDIHNEFYRRGPVAAHLVLTSGRTPRLIAAFPAGNSGVGLWFEPGGQATQWQAAENVQGVRRRLPDGRVLHGVSADLAAVTDGLVVRQAVLSSIRVIRDYHLLGEMPDSVAGRVEHDKHGARWYRDRLDGNSAYELAVEVLAGRIETAGNADTLRFLAPPDGTLRLRITALTGDRPLTPIEAGQVVTSAASADARSREVLAFLSYEEKLLAGSWRFLTYFGRDTLLSVRLMLPVLSAGTIEAGLSSVLARLDDAGEAAHEEDIGEFAMLRSIKDSKPPSDEPIHDYKMVDDDYLLAPVLAEYLLHHEQGRARASAFLERRLDDGTPYGQALARNLRHVVASTAAYAEDPRPSNLIALKPGVPVGQWRDSNEGLGAGRIAYDVNAVLVPAALKASAELVASGLIDDYLPADDRARLAPAGQWAEVWRGAASHFLAHLDAPAARDRIARYGRDLGVPTEDALAAIGEEGVSFHAIALDEDGAPIPVQHSDGGFAMLFGDPDPADLETLVHAAMRPFPAGLITPVGLLVANPVFASERLAGTFTQAHYHGTVVWSWQQALFAAGLERQLRREDLPESLRARLRQAQRTLWDAIDASNETRTAELWSWRYADGRYQVAPFGQALGHKDESNAAQLWSTVYLAIRPPPAPETATPVR